MALVLAAASMAVGTTAAAQTRLFVIVSAFVLTNIYVRNANTMFDELNGQILRESE